MAGNTVAKAEERLDGEMVVDEWAESMASGVGSIQDAMGHACVLELERSRVESLVCGRVQASGRNMVVLEAAAGRVFAIGNPHSRGMVFVGYCRIFDRDMKKVGVLTHSTSRQLVVVFVVLGHIEVVTALRSFHSDAGVAIGDRDFDMGVEEPEQSTVAEATSEEQAATDSGSVAIVGRQDLEPVTRHR